MLPGDYWTDGVSVMFLHSITETGACIVRVWDDSPSMSRVLVMASPDLQTTLEQAGFRKMTGAEVVSWCVGGPVPAATPAPPGSRQ